MRNQFAVTRKQGNFERVMFESSAKKRVYAWLKAMSSLDDPGYAVIDRATSVTWEEGEFIHEFERELNAQRRAKLKAVSDEHKCLTEDQVRAIFQEELTKFLTKAHKDTNVPEYYGNVDLVDTLTSVIDYMAELKTNEIVNKHEEDDHAEA